MCAVLYYWDMTTLASGSIGCSSVTFGWSSIVFLEGEREREREREIERWKNLHCIYSLLKRLCILTSMHLSTCMQNGELSYAYAPCTCL